MLSNNFSTFVVKSHCLIEKAQSVILFRLYNQIYEICENS